MMKHIGSATPIAAFLLVATAGFAPAQVAPRMSAIERCSSIQMHQKPRHSYYGEQNYLYRACMAARGQPE